jgi:hypothetical protein
MDFRSASFKVHIIHIRFHQEYSAPMLGKWVRYESIAPCLSEVESFSLIRYDNGYFLAGPAAAPDVYFCSWMFVIAVPDSIRQSFAERHLNIELLAWNTSRSFN